MSTTYKVEIEFASKGDFDQKTNKLGASLDNVNGKLNTSFSKTLQFGDALVGVGSKIMAPMDAAVSKVAGLAVGFAKLGIGAGIGAATYGVSSLNNELEKTQISLGAIFNANGVSSSIQDGITMAGSTMAQMRKDAAALPGEFQDLANIMKGVAVPGLKAGMSVDQLRSTSANLMAAGAVTGLPMDMVAREAAQLIEGRSGAHNVLGMRLAGLSGEKAETFNKLKPEERIKALTTELNKFAPAIAVYKNSFDGISSTLVDNAKQLLGTATMPLFGQIKNAMADANDWFDANHDKLVATAQDVGLRLSDAFRWGRKTLEEWGPILKTFAENAYDKLAAVWKDIAPTMSKAANSLKEFLQSPKAIDKIIEVLKLYIAAKGVGAVSGGAIDLASGGLNLLTMAKMAGVVGTGTQAAGAGAAGATGAAGVAAGAGAGALLAPVAATVAAAGSWWAVYDQAKALADEEGRDLGSDALARGAAVVRSMDKVDYANYDYLMALNSLTAAQADYKASVLMAAMAAREAADAMRKLADKKIEAQTQDNLDMLTMGTTAMVGQFLSSGKRPGDDEKKKREGMGKHPGGGGMNIQKVEIVVTSNQDPSRIARAVTDKLASLRRNPRMSPDVPNWGGAVPVAG